MIMHLVFCTLCSLASPTFLGPDVWWTFSTLAVLATELFCAVTYTRAYFN